MTEHETERRVRDLEGRMSGGCALLIAIVAFSVLLGQTESRIDRVESRLTEIETKLKDKGINDAQSRSSQP